MHRLSQFWPSFGAQWLTHRWVAPAPANHLHVFPGVHGVVGPVDGSYPTISAQDDPLTVNSGVVIAEPHQQLRMSARLWPIEPVP